MRKVNKWLSEKYTFLSFQTEILETKWTKMTSSDLSTMSRAAYSRLTIIRHGQCASKVRWPSQI